MYELRESPDSNIIEVMVDGSISAAEYHEMAERCLAFIEKHGKVRVLKEIVHFTGLDFQIFKDQLIYALLKHVNDVTATAVVTDEEWIVNLTNLLRPAYSYPVRCFNSSQLEEAREWLKSN